MHLKNIFDTVAAAVAAVAPAAAAEEGREGNKPEVMRPVFFSP